MGGLQAAPIVEINGAGSTVWVLVQLITKFNAVLFAHITYRDFICVLYIKLWAGRIRVGAEVNFVRLTFFSFHLVLLRSSF